MVGNLRKLRKSWAWLLRILVQEGYNPQLLGVLFKAVLQEVLIFGSEMWVMTPRMGRALGGGGHHKVARRITGRHPQQRLGESWE